jgi:CRP-like cAMP-binding protein
MSQTGLEKIELLSGLADEQLAVLDQQCRWHQYSSNAQITDQSGDIQDIFFVIEGTVRLVNYTLSGREITFASVSAGGYFGELAAIDGETRLTSAVAAEKCRLASVSPEVFRKLLVDIPELSLRVLQGLAATVRASDDRIIDLCTLPAPQRVYAELLRMSEPDTVAPGEWVIRPMRTHAEIASRANTTRETVTRALGYLVSNEIIERMSKSLYIRDRETLMDLARSDVEGDEES